MPVLDAFDVPDDLDRRLCEDAAKSRRTLTQQVISVLARGLPVNLDHKLRRQALLTLVQYCPRMPERLREPTVLIREDRLR